MKFVPHPYQAYCIHRLLDDPAVGLFLDMGLGKTVITLTAINELEYDRFAVCRTLIIAPKKVAEATWQREAGKWEHLAHLRFASVLGTQTQRVRALNTPADIWVINRENVPWLVDYYQNDWPFDMVVIDESSSFKSHKAKRFKSLTWVRSRITRMVELTGTPAPNGLLDLWAQIFLLDAGARLGTKITHFRERYFEPDQRGRDMVYSYRPKDGAGDRIRQLIGDICVSMKAEDYLSLPECVYNEIPVVLDTKAAAAYKTLERETLLQINDETVDAGTAAVLTGKLLQLCNGCVYSEEGREVEVHRCKLEAFLEVVESLQGKPVLVFYNFRHDVTRLEAALSGSGLRIRRLRTPEDEVAWNTGGVDVLLAHPASCAYGLNLQAGGNHVIWFGLNWSLELYQQANKRLHRQGQTERVIIHHLVTQGGVDEDVMAALQDKGDTQEQLMQALKARIKRVKEEA